MKFLPHWYLSLPFSLSIPFPFCSLYIHVVSDYDPPQLPSFLPSIILFFMDLFVLLVPSSICSNLLFRLFAALFFLPSVRPVSVKFDKTSFHYFACNRCAQWVLNSPCFLSSTFIAFNIPSKCLFLPAFFSLLLLNSMRPMSA